MGEESLDRDRDSGDCAGAIRRYFIHCHHGELMSGQTSLFLLSCVLYLNFTEDCTSFSPLVAAIEDTPTATGRHAFHRVVIEVFFSFLPPIFLSSAHFSEFHGGKISERA